MMKNKEFILEKVKGVLGLPVRNVKLGIGSFLTMGFGCDIEVDKNMEKRPEWYLWIQYGGWRIDKNGVPICGSEDDRDEIRQAIQILEGKKLTSIHILNKANDTIFVFEEITLSVFGLYTIEYTENWELFTPEKEVLLVGVGYIKLFDEDHNEDQWKEKIIS